MGKKLNWCQNKFQYKVKNKNNLDIRTVQQKFLDEFSTNAWQLDDFSPTGGIGSQWINVVKADAQTLRPIYWKKLGFPHITPVLPPSSLSLASSHNKFVAKFGNIKISCVDQTRKIYILYALCITRNRGYDNHDGELHVHIFEFTWLGRHKRAVG